VQSRQERTLLSSKPRRLRAANPASRAEQPDPGSSVAVDYEVLARFRYELRKFQAFSKAAAEKNGLSPQQHQAMLTIKGFSSEGPISVGDLAEFLLIRHHTAVELVNRMVKLKLLSRTVDAADGRRVLVTLTREGEVRLHKLSRIHFDELRAIGPTLTRILKPFRPPGSREPD
jgi:DNA-binding MarR family transcriptional regulator